MLQACKHCMWEQPMRQGYLLELQLCGLVPCRVVSLLVWDCCCCWQLINASLFIWSSSSPHSCFHSMFKFQMLYVTLEPWSHTSMLIGLALQFWGKKVLSLDKSFFSTLKILSSVPQHYCCWVWGKSFFLALLLSLFVCCPMLFQDLASIYFTTLPSDVMVLSFHWFVGKLSGNLSSGDVPVNSEGVCGYSTFRGASC